MRKITFVLLLTVFFLNKNAVSQTIDYNVIILPQNVKTITIAERLVQLAWQQNPSNRISENNIQISKKEIALSNSGWLNIIRVSANINEYTINPDYAENVGARSFYPRYNFAAYIPLDIFVSIPKNTQIARLRHQNTTEELKSKKLEVRATVLRLYEIYKREKEVYKIQFAMTDEIYSQYILAEQEFKNGRITYDEWSANFNTYNNQAIAKINAKTTLEMAKIELEKIIGISIDSIVGEERE